MTEPFFTSAQVTKDDLETMFEDFQEATYNGQTIKVLFDNAPVEEDFNGEVAVETTRPQALCRTVDVPNVERGETLVINGTTYYVRGKRPDPGYGTTLLILSLE